MKYLVSWQVFGSKEVDADDADEAMLACSEWLEDDHGMTSSVADGWDYHIDGTPHA